MNLICNSFYCRTNFQKIKCEVGIESNWFAVDCVKQCSASFRNELKNALKWKLLVFLYSTVKMFGVGKILWPHMLNKAAFILIKHSKNNNIVKYHYSLK